MAHKPELDPHTGVHTTGHEWDGIKELNNPLPKWWLYVMYVTIVWSVVYWILLPAWPLISDYTKGVLGHSQRAQVANELADKLRMQSGYVDKIRAASLEEIRSDPQLLSFALAGARSVFGDNCAGCHGTGAQGGYGFPNLNDDDWLWGGTLDAIYTTLKVGIRSGHPETRFNDMPAFGTLGALNRQEIDDVVSYVRSLSFQGENPAAVERGRALYAANCAACHGEDGKGNQELGSPDLADRYWLYGGDRTAIFQTVYSSRGGVMPSWSDRLDEATIKQLAVYIHSLGGGK
jgi:cytochrome c oxidase cbb3-type subunit III